MKNRKKKIKAPRKLFGKDISEKDALAKIRASLRYSINDGSWWSVMVGAGESYLSAFALFLKATPFQIGILQSVPQLVSSVTQLLAFKLTNIFQSRKRIVLNFVFLQSLVWLFIIGLSYWTKNVWVLVLLSCLYFLFGSIPTPAWSSWMGDLVRPDLRGRYFGNRNRIVGLITFLSTLAAGLILEYFSKIDTFFAFSILFSIAFVARMISWYYLSLKYEPKVELRKPKPYGFFQFLGEMHKTNFGMFTLFISFLTLVVNMASPFFIVYWLNVLNFSYIQYTILLTITTIMSFLTMTYWGKSADHYGNRSIMEATSVLIVLIPLYNYLLIYFKDISFYLLIFFEIIGGFAWAGFNLSASNFLYDLVEPENRIRLISYHNALKGIALFIGALIGGFIVKINMTGISSPIVTKVIPSGLILVMIISFIGRIIVPLIFIKKIREVKITKHRPNIVGYVARQAVHGMVMDSVIGMNRTIKRFRKQLLRIEAMLDYIDEKK